MALSKVYNGTSWITGLLKVWTGSAWSAKPNFYDGTVQVPLYATINDIVTITTGSTSSAFKFGSNATAYIYFNSDGTKDYKANTSANIQKDATTDWVIPNGSAPGSYRIKYSSLTGDTAFYVGSVSTVYAALTSNRYFAVYDSTAFAGGKTIALTAHIDNGTTEQDSNTLNLTADREDF